MRAALLTAVGSPLELTEVPRPVPRPHEVVVAVRAVGICATDLKIAAGLMPTLTLPRVLGHEVAGEVEEGTDAVAVGMRVAVRGLLGCGRCPSCAIGNETICSEASYLGLQRDGGFAEYVVVPVESVIPIPDSLSFEAAAVTMDSVLATYRALVTRGGLRPGESVLIVGAGGLGLAAVQVGISVGARVAVVDLDPDHQAAALQAGAEIAVGPEGLEEVRAWSAGGVDLGLETAGARAAFDLLAALMKPGGRIVCNGYQPGREYGIQSLELVTKEISVLGSRNGNHSDALAALHAVADGAIAPLIAEVLPLEQVADAMARLRAGLVVGRIVLRP